MLVSNPKKSKRVVATRCRYCDRRFFFAYPSRTPKFCSTKCRQAEFRYVETIARSVGAKRDENPQKSRAKAKFSKAGSGDRPLPLNVVGGRRWSNAIAVDRETLAEIIETELGGFKSGEANSESPNPYLAEITDDLSIPAFLRRRPK